MYNEQGIQLFQPLWKSSDQVGNMHEHNIKQKHLSRSWLSCNIENASHRHMRDKN